MISNARRLLVAVVLTSFMACSGGSSNGGDTGEPNNTIMQANIPSWEKPVDMKIDSTGDVDWYGIPTKGQGYVSVQAKQIPSNIQLQLRFAHRQPWEAQKYNWTSEWRELPTAIPVPKADTLFFMLQDKWNDNASDTAIEIRASYIKEFDEQEPNNSPAKATTLKTGQMNTAYIYPKGDLEYFKVRVDTQGYLFTKAKEVPEDLQLEVKYLAYNKWEDKTEKLREYGELPYGVFIADTGHYYIEMIDNWNDAAAKDPISWKVDFIPEMDRHEPNNKLEDAATFKAGDTLHPAIFPIKDQDFFSIKPASDISLQLLAKGHEDIKPIVKLFEKQGTEYEKVSEWKKLPTKLELTGNEAYIIQLQDDYSDARRPEAFMILTKAAAGS